MRGAENPFGAFKFKQQSRILSIMNRHLLLHSHKKLIAATRIILNQTRFLPQPTTEAPPPSNEVHHSETLIAANGERELPGGMEGEVVNGLAMNGGERLEVNEAVGVVEAEGAIGGGGDEVAREEEVGRGVESEGGDGGGVVVEGAERGGGGEVVEVDCVVGAA